ncbi:hypothetical protein GUJ93_ZPchr0013g34410 [Zizania palustris]|uniref:B box-type domain-containing protein n=1 Tax=Zizania palustris TaxID=103762 RepID=A0A8J6BYV7_ZIZPA|nr:hypothetical protein GUJ93_ZPchr0013g34410 [Zizania palustris]
MGKEIAVEEAEPLPPTTEEAAVVEAEEAPEWLRVLLLTSFWGQCPEHWEASRAEVCLFCIVCHEVVCPHCTHDEPGHRLLKVRRYIYRSVVLAKDMQDLNVDVSRVQSYIVNGQKGVHLRPMRRSMQFKPPTGTPCCLTCLCWLHSAPNTFCSLACMVEGPFEALLEAVQQEDAVTVNVPESESLAVGGGGGGDESSSDAHSFRRRPRKQAEPQRAPFF